jgi:hypothetical protein
MATTTERPERETESTVSDARTSTGAAVGWIALIVISFAITLFLIFRAASQM